MRLWSLHPHYLDSKGLGAVWREGLLAQAILLGKTKGWKNHPQLTRFKNHVNPLSAICFYLHRIYDEAITRGYRYQQNKIHKNLQKVNYIPVTRGQLLYESLLLLERLQQRSPNHYEVVLKLTANDPYLFPHPLFLVIDGDVELWETAYWRKKRQ
jgi:hypothetical protein